MGKELSFYGIIRNITIIYQKDDGILENVLCMDVHALHFHRNNLCRSVNLLLLMAVEEETALAASLKISRGWCENEMLKP